MFSEKDQEVACKINKTSDFVNKGLLGSILLSIIPHMGCIMVIIFTLIGITVGNVFLKNILSAKWFAPSMVALSFIFAGSASFFYLRKKCCVNKARYLLVLFVSVLIVNFLLLYVIFPWVANINGRSVDATVQNLSVLKIQTDIPCSGHAPLIVYELKKAGVNEVSFSNPDIFNIKYDASKLSKDDILGLELFKDFKIKKVL